MRMRRTTGRGAALMLAAATLSGCDISDLVAVDPPTGFQTPADPNAFNNEAGTFELYKGVLNKFREATSGRTSPGAYIVMSGLLGDELNAGKTNTGTAGGFSTQSIVDGRSMTPEEVLRIADEALYRAKNDGRNCVRHSVVMA